MGFPARLTNGIKKSGQSKMRDMTVGNPMKLIIGFAVPLLFGLLFQQMYSFVDTAIVGRYLGSDALAAVGSTGSLNFLIVGFCMGMCSGFAIPIAQNFGAHNEYELRRSVWHSVYLSAGLSLALGLLTGILSPLLLRWSNTPDEILEAANEYIQLMFYGIPVTVLYNMSGSILRSLGDSKTPVFYLVVASVLNIVLDLVFIINLGMGTAGAAWATLISQLVSGLGCVYTMIRRFPILRGSREEKKPDYKLAVHMFGLGAPMGLQFSITAIGSVILQYFVNGLGTDAVAAIAAAFRLSGFFTVGIEALSTTMATYAGQNLGARQLSRISKGLACAVLIGFVYVAISWLSIRLFGRQMFTLFVSEEERNVIDLAYQFMLIHSSAYVLLIGVNCFRLTIQGMGYTMVAVIAGVMEMIARSLVGVVLVAPFGYIGACYSGMMAWIFADAFLIPCFFVVMRRLRKRMPDAA